MTGRPFPASGNISGSGTFTAIDHDASGSVTGTSTGTGKCPGTAAVQPATPGIWPWASIRDTCLHFCGHRPWDGKRCWNNRLARSMLAPMVTLPVLKLSVLPPPLTAEKSPFKLYCERPARRVGTLAVNTHPRKR